jgi:hypothetical protein
MGSRTVLMVDFNDLDVNRCVPAPLVLDNANANPSIDEVVELRDEDGNAVEGYVVALEGKVALVAPEWSRWRTTRSVVMRKSGEPTAEDMVLALLNAARFGVPSRQMVD